jgi:hypothetical protein
MPDADVVGERAPVVDVDAGSEGDGAGGFAEDGVRLVEVDLALVLAFGARRCSPSSGR